MPKYTQVISICFLFISLCISDRVTSFRPFSRAEHNRISHFIGEPGLKGEQKGKLNSVDSETQEKKNEIARFILFLHLDGLQVQWLVNFPE